MTWPLDQLTIHRFRGIRELSLPGLGLVNLLVGGNNTGKTSVLEALSLYCAPQDPWTWISTARRREPMPIGRHAYELERLRLLFPQDLETDRLSPYEGSIRLSARGSFTVRAFTAGYRELRSLHPVPTRPEADDASGDEETDIEIERRGAQIDVDVELEPEQQVQFDFLDESSPLRRSFTLWEDERFSSPQSRSNLALQARSISPYDHWLQSLPLRGFSEAMLSGIENDILKLLRSIDPRIAGVEILAPRGYRPALYLRDGTAGLLPLSAFGDGVRRVLLMALTLPRVAGGVLLIDEIETAIHVSALDKVFRWMLEACKHYAVQLFVTTHSLEALDAILAADTSPEEDIVGYRLERTEAGTVMRRYGEDLLKRLRHERGADVR